MVGHEAIRMQLECAARRSVEKSSHDRLGGCGFGQEGMATVAADGYEMGAEAEVVLGGQAGLFAGKRHIASMVC